MIGPSARRGLVSSVLCATAMAQFLFVSSYDGNVTTLDMGALSSSRPKAAPDGKVPKPVELKTVGKTTACGDSPSILRLDMKRRIVYCLNEGIVSGKGGLAALQMNDKTAALESGTLKEGDPGPVFGGLFPGGKSMAVANFGNASISVWDVSDPNNLRITQTERFTLDKPGPVADKQTASKPHQTLVDPTGKFVVVCDFGADMLRIFRIDGEKLTAAGNASVEAGSGPRHAAFTKPQNNKARMVLVNELSPRVDVFDVAYEGDGMELKLASSVPVHGEGTQAPKDAFPSEVVISPDNKFVMVSSRNENKLKATDFRSGTEIASDPIISFTLDETTGKLKDAKEVPAGGKFPRQFSMNKAGTMLAVALQKDERVLLIPRDPSDGTLGAAPVAFASVPGEVTSVIFAETSDEEHVN
ncbi:hypothetical protein XA68_18198 [Ophiocordyceps unilateralis]|uniref:6-phosphogluconolactonase n=1 Tax=Ophiocordyceps unilateralis TaxID=268505 RepID=A0A2A9P2B6_OPHUN|nr:hypothetical protein XA68_18198 [Ophiocordyceps unilateralis]